MPVLSVNVKLTNIPNRGVTTIEAAKAVASSLFFTFPSHKTILPYYSNKLANDYRPVPTLYPSLPSCSGM